MDKLELHLLKAEISGIYFLKTKGKIGNVDDCVGFVLKSRIISPRQPTHFAVVDYIRAETDLRHSEDPHKNAKYNLYFADRYDSNLCNRTSHNAVERDIILNQSLAGLSETDRATIILYLKWGLTLSEIAHVFGLTESGVSFRISKACLKIRQAQKT